MGSDANSTKEKQYALYTRLTLVLSSSGNKGTLFKNMFISLFLSSPFFLLFIYLFFYYIQKKKKKFLSVSLILRQMSQLGKFCTGLRLRATSCWQWPPPASRTCSLHAPSPTSTSSSSLPTPSLPSSATLSSRPPWTEVFLPSLPPLLFLPSPLPPSLPAHLDPHPFH